MPELPTRRVDRLLRRCIAEQDLDLSGLTVYTEAATGAYLYTPILAALAGAERVFALTRDSRYGSREAVRADTLEAAEHWSVADRVEVVFDKDPEHVAASDIVTNSGFVRPIDARMVSWMKPSAVVALMWEPWEMREGEVDVAACAERGILVMGTNEGPPLDLYPYGGFLGLKVLFELGLEGHKTAALVLGGDEGLGRSIYQHFRRVGMRATWFTLSEPDSLPYSELEDYFRRHGAEYDVLLVTEQAHPLLLLGPGGVLDLELISQINPALCIGVLAGNVDAEALRRSGLSFFPPIVRPFGYMSYQAGDLGPRPVLELYAAGLKVGQEMARARIAGLSPEAAERHALANSPAMALGKEHYARS